MAILVPSIKHDAAALPRPAFREHLLHAVELVELWTARASQRRALRQLPEHVIHDIALSQADVEHEASKPFWQA